MSETVDHAIELEAVKAQLALYRDAVESMHQGVCMYDAGGRIILVNRRYTEQLRLPPESVQPGQTASDVLQMCIDAGHYPGQTPAEVRARIKSKIAQGSSLGTMVRGDRTYAMRRCPAPGGNLLTTCEDITAQVEAERALRDGIGERRFRRIEGVADRELLIENNPQDPRNRRMSILLSR